MNTTVFVELKFWLLVTLSRVVPVLIYAVLMKRRAISRAAVLLFGLALILIAGLDVYLLQSLATLAKSSLPLADDAIFSSEISLALYISPILFGGVGVNLVSHVLVEHLLRAERQFDRAHAERH